MKIEYRIPALSEYTLLRDTTSWGSVDKKALEKALINSLFSVVVLEGNQIIGCGRIIGDDGLYFYIQDLIVHPDFQNKGVGKRMMNELMNHIQKIATPGAFIGLMAAKGLVNYYQSFGFKPRDDDAPGMFYIVK